MTNPANSRHGPPARSNHLALSLVGLFTFCLLLITAGSVAAETQKPINAVQSVEADSPLSTPPGDRDCYLLYYYDDTATSVYVWPIPDAYGDDYFNMRFTAEGGWDVCTLKVGWFMMYGNYMTGTPDMKAYLWDDDGFGFPGMMLDSALIPYGSLPTSGFGWVSAPWNQDWIFPAGTDYHIGWSTVQNTPADTLVGVSDKATGPHSNTGEVRASEYWTGVWGTMLADWGVDVCFFIESEICCGNYPSETEIIIDQVDGEAAPGQVYADTPLRFYCRGTNNSMYKVDGFSNGFRVYSPTGATFDDITWDSMSIGWSTRFDMTGLITNVFHGTTEDSILFGGVAMMGPGFEPGFDEQMWTINTRVSSSNGDTLCIDSAFIPPAGTWTWNQPVGAHAPGWGGPYCYEIVPRPIQPVLGKAKHNMDDYLPKRGNPIGSQWHELWPNFCQDSWISDWRDNGDGTLSFCDYVEFTDAVTGRTSWEHIAEVTKTVSINDDSAYFEQIDPDPEEIEITHPVGTFWHEVHPQYCQIWEIQWWEDNGNGYLDSCDYIGIENVDDPSGPIMVHVSWKVTTDIKTDPIPDPEWPDDPPPDWEWDDCINGYNPSDGDPTGSMWQEMYPSADRDNYVLDRWHDNGDGYLSQGDTVRFESMDKQGVFLWKIPYDVPPTVILSLGNDTFYFDYMCGNFMVNPIFAPKYTFWYQVYPWTRERWRVVDWIDNGNGFLDYCDWITMIGIDVFNFGIIHEFHVEGIRTDMITWRIPAPYLDTCDFYKSPYEDYAPQGMPDFDQKQTGWLCPDPPDKWNHCGPAAIANCLWWFDSKFEPMPVDPRPFYPGPGNPPPNDNYRLVETYDVRWDDHDTSNAYPFITELGNWMKTCQYIFHGTHIDSLVSGTRQYIQSKGLSYALRDSLVPGPTYPFITEQVSQSQDVVLLLGFYHELAPGAYIPLGGHYVTVAGFCTHDRMLCISDPWFDMLEGEPPAGSAHGPTVHNDADNISGPHSQIQHDPYNIHPITIPGYPRPVEEVVAYPFDDQTGFNFEGMNLFPGSFYMPGIPIVTTIEYAYVTCPDTSWKWGWHLSYEPYPDVDLTVSVYPYFVSTVTPVPYTIWWGSALWCVPHIDYMPTWPVVIRFSVAAGPKRAEASDMIVAAPRHTGTVWRLHRLPDYLEDNVPAGKAAIPDLPSVMAPGGVPTLYQYVNIEEWLADPRPPQPVYSIVNGECDDLPGYLIGTTPITFDSLAPPSPVNPFTTTPYTGPAELLGDVSMQSGGGCCVERGDVNHAGDGANISDLTYLVEYLFGGGPPPECMEEGNVNNQGDPPVDISDLTYMVDYMFSGGPPPPPCD